VRQKLRVALRAVADEELLPHARIAEELLPIH
jgi:hypothetical protein